MPHEAVFIREKDQISKGRLTAVMLACIAFAIAVLIRAAYIQLLNNPRLENMARRQFQSNVLIRPRRGAILDRSGEPLAINVQRNSLAANPSKLRNKRHVANLLSRALGYPRVRLLERLNEKKEFIWIKRQLSDAQMRKLKKWHLIDSSGDLAGTLVEGLWLVKESNRVYPHGRLASHILGDVNVDSEGIEGVELWMNESLRGKVVSLKAVKDALGRPTLIDEVAARNVQDGQPIALTIDATLQFEVESHLSNAVRKTGSRGGSVIVMNPTTGDILAMANEPSFNAEDKAHGKFIPSENRRNRALTDGFEPGSTLKAVLLASALSHGWKLTDKVWGEHGSFKVQDHRISEAEAHEKFEWVSLKKMIQVSSNVAAAKIALKLGADSYLHTLQGFGFGEKSGIGFPGEISGKIPPRKEWQPLALANIGFGQGLLVTPIQMLKAYAAIANGGWLVTPRLIKNPQVIPLALPTRLISAKVSREVTTALATVTQEGGTGRTAAVPGYLVAGKTGTAQMVDPATRRYSRTKYISSFVGFPLNVIPNASSSHPVGDLKDPRVVIFTSLVEPKGNYYASETAAPLFREVLGSVINHLGIPSQILAQDSIRVSRAAPISPVPSPSPEPVFLAPQKEGLWSVPSFKGMTPREVLGILKGHKFDLQMTGLGIVSSQVPAAGMGVAEGETIRLILVEP